MDSKPKSLIVISSPSGGGKTTVVRHLMKIYPNMRFSVSATTRNKRPNETYGVDYIYISKDDFQKKIKNGELVEYEEIFGNYYGTLRSEIENALSTDEILIFDVDVKGALNLKLKYPEDSMLVFLMPPSEEALKQRLTSRSTESDKEIETRLARAKMEMDMTEGFDYVIINDNLQDTFRQIEEIAAKHLKK
ncbi:MAG: guanylate kinase [Candidatus Kapaibacterium sp.]